MDRAVRIEPLRPLPDLIVGVDAAYTADDRKAVGAAVVIDANTHELVEAVTVVAETGAPYVPGRLAEREAPVLLAAIDRLEHRAELVVCDGHGIAHPDRFGLACHVGVALDVPTIGCAKTRFIGEHEPVGPNRGDRRALVHDGDEIGAVLRTRDGVKPVYVSPGHRIDIASAVNAILALTGRYRLPETTRQSDAACRRAPA